MSTKPKKKSIKNKKSVSKPAASVKSGKKKSIKRKSTGSKIKTIAKPKVKKHPDVEDMEVDVAIGIGSTQVSIDEPIQISADLEY